jgi:phage terminase large subunit GpA-like protein
MDEGAVIAWPARYNHDEVSAIQHSMNLKLQDSYAFAAEYQNEPEFEQLSTDIMTAEIIASRNNGYGRGIVPGTCTTLTGGIDIHKGIIVYAIWAFDESGRAYLVEYNTIPEQPSRMFNVNSLQRTLEDYYKCTFEEAIQAGLLEFIDKVHSMNFKTSTGFSILLSHAFCDSGYKPDIVYRVKRMRRLSNFEPSKGIGIKAANKPIEKYIKKRGEKHGWHWYYPNVRGTREYPHCAIDVNWFKSLINNGVMRAESAPGSVSFWGEKTTRHEIIIDHFTAQTFTETRGHGRIVNEWTLKPSRREDHYLDCSVYAFAAASKAGIKFPEQDGSGKKPLMIPRAEKKYMKLSEIQKIKREGKK